MRKAGTIEVEVNSLQTAVAVDEVQLTGAVRDVLQGEGVRAASVSLALVDDAEIRRLNRQYLDHDYATDVLSFPLGQEDGYLEGEIVVSGQTAVRSADRYGWSAAEELMLYVIHGCLHLTGCDDQSDTDRRKMRQLESKYMGHLGLTPRWDEEAAAPEVD
jgi:probable rRNA maturation factor